MKAVRKLARDVLVGVVSGVLVSLIVPAIVYFFSVPVLVYHVRSSEFFKFARDGGDWVKQAESATYTITLTNRGFQPIEDLSVTLRPSYTAVIGPAALTHLPQVRDYNQPAKDTIQFRLEYLNPGDPFGATVSVAPQNRVPDADEVIVQARAKGVTAISQTAYLLAMAAVLLAGSAVGLVVLIVMATANLSRPPS